MGYAKFSKNLPLSTIRFANMFNTSLSRNRAVTL